MIDLSTTVREMHYMIRLNEGFRSDLRWWATFLPSWNGVGMMSGVIPAEVSLSPSVLCTDRGIPSLLHNPSAVSNVCLHSLAPMMRKSSKQCSIGFTPCCSNIHCIGSATALKTLGGGGGGQISAQMGESSQCKSFPSSEFPGVACRQRALVCTFSPIEEQILQSLE